MTLSGTTDKAFFWLTVLYVAIAVWLTGWLLIRRFRSAHRSTVHRRSTFHDDVRKRLVEQVFSANSHMRDNSSDTGDNEGTPITQKVERRRETQRFLAGQLKPTDCMTARVACLKAENCTLLCKNAAVLDFACVKGVCMEKPIGIGGINAGGNNSNDQSNCDLKNGEIGLLVGYNEIGTAQWECVQLYPGWEKRNAYCEGGTVDIDARFRTPSYRDCVCPGGTTRMTYRRSTLGQTVYGRPHCIRNPVMKFYEIDYEAR